MRPFASVSTAGLNGTGLAFTPAAHMTTFAESLRPLAKITSSFSTSVTVSLATISTPLLLSTCAALAPNCGLNCGSKRSPPCTSVKACGAFSMRNVFISSSKYSCASAATSTPVGPPPTTTTRGISPFLKRPTKRAFTARASAKVLSDKTRFCASTGSPKKLVPDPSAYTR